MAVESNDVDALIGRGNILLKLKQFTEAEKDFNTALKIIPKSRRAAIGRIKARYGKGRHFKARLMYRSFRKKRKIGDLELEVLFFKKAKEILVLIKKNKGLIFFLTLLTIIFGPAALYTIYYCFIKAPLFMILVLIFTIRRINKWYMRKKRNFVI